MVGLEGIKTRLIDTATMLLQPDLLVSFTYEVDGLVDSVRARIAGVSEWQIQRTFKETICRWLKEQVGKIEYSPEVVEAMFDELPTEEGKDVFSYTVLLAGLSLEQKYLHHALNYLIWHLEERRNEAITLGQKIGVTETEIDRRIEAYRLGYKEAEREAAENSPNRAVILEEAKKLYSIDSQGALKAEQDGRYEMALVIYENISNEEIDRGDNPRLQEIFDIPWKVDDKRAAVYFWALHKAIGGIHEYRKEKMYDYMKLFNRFDPVLRSHAANNISSFAKLGDFDEEFKQCAFCVYGFDDILNSFFGEMSMEERIKFARWAAFYKKYNPADLSEQGFVKLLKKLSEGMANND